MDREKLKEKIQPVIINCKEKGINIVDVIIEEVEMFKGTARTQFYVDLCIPDLTAENYNNIYDRVFDIYWDIIDEDIRSFISDFSVTNECENIHYCGNVNV